MKNKFCYNCLETFIEDGPFCSADGEGTMEVTMYHSCDLWKPIKLWHRMVKFWLVTRKKFSILCQKMRKKMCCKTCEVAPCFLSCAYRYLQCEGNKDNTCKTYGCQNYEHKKSFFQKIKEWFQNERT